MRFWLGCLFSSLVTFIIIIVKDKLFVELWIMYLLRSSLEIFMMKELMYGVWEYFAINFVQEEPLFKAKLAKIRPTIKS